jgi:hypothetical protein
MILPRMTLNEQKSSVHSIDFGSENTVKIMKAIRKYLPSFMKALPIDS